MAEPTALATVSALGIDADTVADGKAGRVILGIDGISGILGIGGISGIFISGILGIDGSVTASEVVLGVMVVLVVVEDEILGSAGSLMVVSVVDAVIAMPFGLVVYHIHIQ